MSPGCTIANGCFKHPAYIRQEPQSTCGNDDSCWRCNWSSARGTSAPEAWDIRNSFHITPLYKLCLQCCLPCSLGQSRAKAFLWRCAWPEPGEHSEQNQSTHSPRILHTCLLGLSQSYLIIPACLVLSPWFSLHSKILGHSFTELCPSRWFRFIHLQERKLYGQFNDPSHHVCSGFDEQWAWFLI